MAIALDLPKDHALRSTIEQYKKRFEEYSDEYLFSKLKTTLHKSWWFTNFFFSGTILRNSSVDLAVPQVRDFCSHITHVYIYIFTNLNT